MEGPTAFRTLTAGIRFNKKSLPRQPAAAPTASTSAVPLAAPVPSSQNKRKRKAKEVEPEQEDESDGGDEDVAEPAEDTPIDSDALRKTLRIRCTGSDLPPLWPTFDTFPSSSLPAQVISNLSVYGVQAPSSIQMQACSIIYSDRDLLACAPTGSGKTLAYLLPLLMLASSTSEKQEGPSALVIEPTRELARQVYSEAGRIRKGTKWSVAILGEEEEQEESDEDLAESDSNPDLIITTPLKLVYAIKAGSISLSNVRHLILDEADKLFELGFLEQTDSIIAACTSPSLRKAMFSATIPSGVEELARSVMSSDSIRVIIGGSDAATSTISQELLFAGNEDGKLVAIKNLVKQGGMTPPALVFVQSIDRAKDLNRELLALGVKSDVMHSERSRKERDEVVQRFGEAKIWVLVCTDVMARGVDFRGVELVINYNRR